TGHGTIVNSAAQRRLKIDPTAPVPGGWYGKDTEGHFDGRLYEYTQWRMRAVQPPPADADEIAALERNAAESLKFGIASQQVMAMMPPSRF
ncbi:hypothetical protein RCK87_25525, partial [Salmonella enterica subsp. enterica serovar 1,4,[5],12:i:-]